MADFDDDTNPFGDNDGTETVVEASQAEEVNEPPQTPAKATSTPQQPQPSYKGYPGLSPKTNFCCVRDEYLHSDDAEIQVCACNSE
jgi:hypothetical protein